MTQQEGTRKDRPESPRARVLRSRKARQPSAKMTGVPLTQHVHSSAVPAATLALAVCPHWDPQFLSAGVSLARLLRTEEVGPREERPGAHHAQPGSRDVEGA